MSSSSSSNGRSDLGEKRPAAGAAADDAATPITKKHRDKRDKADTETTTAPATSECVGKLLGLKAGDRVEVLWDLHLEDDGGDEAGDEGGEKGSDEVDTEKAAEGGTAQAGDGCVTKEKDATESRWWGATLLEEDGRTMPLEDEDGSTATVAPIRVLDYDPYPEGGFPERSREEVVFLSNHSVLMGSGDSGHWRREGEAWEPSPDGNPDEDEITNEGGLGIPVGRDGLRAVLDAILLDALGKNSGKMKALSAAQQAVVAERIARGKEKFIEKLMEQMDSTKDGDGTVKVISAEHVRQCMAELK